MMPPSPAIKSLRLARGPLYKSTLLLTSPLLCVLLIPPDHARASTVGLYYLNLFLYLCFAYAVNDWADRDADRAAGKQRLITALPEAGVLLIVLTLLVATLITGYVLAKSWAYVSALALGLFMGLAYSMPPWRIKNRGIWGIVFAPVLGKVMPVLLSCIVYHRFDWYFLAIALAEWTKNAIDILFHQLLDYTGDHASDVLTYPVACGLESAKSLLKKLAVAGTFCAFAVGWMLAWLVTEYRWIFSATILLMIPAVLAGRRFGGGFRTNAIMLNLPLPYLWLGGIVFLQSPMWLGLIAASRNLCFLPLAMFLTVVTLSQTVFYMRYHYY